MQKRKAVRGLTDPLEVESAPWPEAGPTVSHRTSVRAGNRIKPRSAVRILCGQIVLATVWRVDWGGGRGHGQLGLPSFGSEIDRAQESIVGSVKQQNECN